MTKFTRLQGQEALIFYSNGPNDCNNSTILVSLSYAEQYLSGNRKYLKITWEHHLPRIWYIRFLSGSFNVSSKVPLTIEVIKKSGDSSNRTCELHVETFPVHASYELLLHRFYRLDSHIIRQKLQTGVFLSIDTSKIYYNRTWASMQRECEKSQTLGNKTTRYGLPYFSNPNEETLALKALYFIQEAAQIQKYPFIFFYGLRKLNNTVSNIFLFNL